MAEKQNQYRKEPLALVAPRLRAALQPAAAGYEGFSFVYPAVKKAISTHGTPGQAQQLAISEKRSSLQ